MFLLSNNYINITFTVYYTNFNTINEISFKTCIRGK